MLSSLISERTVKKGAPFSHTLSLSPPFIYLFVYPCPSIVRSGGPDKAINSIPLHVHSPPPLLLSAFSLYSPPIFLASHLFLAITLTRTCLYPPPPPLLFFFSSNIYIHQLPRLFNPVISCLTKLFNNTISVASRLITFSVWHTLLLFYLFTQLAQFFRSW